MDEQPVRVTVFLHDGVISEVVADQPEQVLVAVIDTSSDRESNCIAWEEAVHGAVDLSFFLKFVRNSRYIDCVETDAGIWPYPVGDEQDGEEAAWHEWEVNNVLYVLGRTRWHIFVRNEAGKWVRAATRFDDEFPTWELHKYFVELAEWGER